MNLKEHFTGKIFSLISQTADELGLECYVVGGYVRDIFLNRPSKDIDVVVVGSGIQTAEALGKRLGPKAHVSVFHNFGTAQVKFFDTEVEFVGARKESYNHDSRKPVVEDGTLEDDQNRRDFTINALAVCMNKARFGELIDPFGGLDDLKQGIIRTPLDPDITFSDDPLRMLRCIRFATQLNFYIEDETFNALERNRERIKIISYERIKDELNKILLSPIPSKGFVDLDRCGLLELIFPELTALQGVEVRNGRGHKDNFYHTLEVVDNIAKVSDNLWLRWATLLHDIGKPRTKRWDPRLGWTFHNHNYIGEKMVPEIFRRMKLPMNEKMKYVQKLVGLHMRPIVIADDSGIEIDFFDRKPGIYSSRWLGEDTPYEIKNQIVLDRMKEVPDDKRTARYVCALVAVVPARLIPGDFSAAAKAQELSVVETVEGLIAHEPKGNGGFGYDPIFLIPEAGQTFAEMTAEEKHAISHRGKALRALIQLFQSHHLLD